MKDMSLVKTSMFKTRPTCDSFSANIVQSLSIRMKFISCPLLDLMCVQLMFLFETVDGKAVLSKEEIEAIDDKNNTVTYNVIGGLLKEFQIHYSSHYKG
jgi:hypothetical protein